jgi:hypothetical protein
MPDKTVGTANVVITANIFNMTIFNQIWLQRHEIFTEEELTSSPENVFMPLLVQVSTQNCHMLVVPERLQMTLHTPADPGTALGKVRTIVQLLPETPYTALGLNAIWHLSIGAGERINEFTRRNFAVPGHPLYDYFSIEDAKFGTYVSKSFRDFRLRGDFKPVIIPSGADMVQMNFNFNLDLSGRSDKAAAIQSGLNQWMDAFHETETIIDKLT